MKRWTLVAILVLLPLLAGCGQRKPVEPPGNLILILPTSLDYPEYLPDLVSKLTIDDKDYSEPRTTRRRLQVEPKEGTDRVKIVYSFWPNTYTNIIRTRVVKLDGDTPVEVDLTNEDPAHPDHIKPIFFPTPREVVRQMCKMAKVGPSDVVYDIGCGDGRVVITAVKEFGAKKGIGIDIREELIAVCKKNAAKDKVADRTEFRAADALTIKDLSDASVVLLYLGEHLNDKMQPALKTLKPGSRIVSHRFLIGDWKPDASKTFTATNDFDLQEQYTLHLWEIK